MKDTKKEGHSRMNEHSSRSHAILTVHLNQCCHGNSSLKSLLSSKLCLIDLAGSERAGKTGNTGARLKESAHVNTGLLALGNVIRALSDPRSQRGNSVNGAHIPYRDAKITRLLRDSLGGTAHTLMVACVSPSDHSVAETLSVLQFASKARHVRNHPAAVPAHREQVQAEVYRSLQRMRLQRAQLQAGLRQHAETREDHNELDHNGVRYTFTPVYSESGNLS
uniref:Kinesin motor domain-containing protein n=1 Tax=Mola mola TaxID=94237 RepID=A0A3Q3VVD4_MOLML